MTWKYKPKTDDELEQLAQDIVAGRVFHSELVDSPRDLQMVFMVTLFMDQETLSAMQEAGVSLMYEYMEKALPRSINGMPCFMSMEVLNKEDTHKMIAKAREIQAFLKGRKGGSGAGTKEDDAG